jgi:hypothetical protein
MNNQPNPNTELGLMQMLADADREAKEQFAAWLVDFRGRLGKPRPAPMPMVEGPGATPMPTQGGYDTAPMPKVTYG